jgi:hypothetical protein
MKLKVWLAACTLVAAVALNTAADEPKKSTHKMSPEEEAMMKAASPGPEHKKLEGMVGSWSVKVKMWPAPGAPAQESSGTATRKWVLGGRYVQESFSGNFMGMPFTGVGYTGYDNIKKQYFGSWMDSMSTAMMISTGTMDNDHTWTFKGSMPDAMTGKDAPFEETITVKDKDHHTFEMRSAGPDGKMFKMMEIAYSRKK